jgi:acetyltransferase-like isoleucine patch superfamily enzyme
MIQLFRRLRRRFLQRAPSFTVGHGTLLQDGFGVDVRAGHPGSRITIGGDSVLECTITLERELGSVHIGDCTFIGASHLVCAQEILIGSNVLIAWGCTITDHDSHSMAWPQRKDDVKNWRLGLAKRGGRPATTKDWSVVPMRPIHIADKAWIGFNSIILKGVKIGEGSIVGAGSVVTKDVPPWTIVGGNPAKFIRTIAEHER